MFPDLHLGRILAFIAIVGAIAGAVLLKLFEVLSNHISIGVH